MKPAVLSPAARSRWRCNIARRTSAWVPLRKTRPEASLYLSSSETGKADIPAPKGVLRIMPSEQGLLTSDARGTEERTIELDVAPGKVEAEALAALLEALAQQLREEARADHARAEARIVVAAIAHLVDSRHHVRGLEREVLVQPGAEDVLHLPRQA